MKQLLLALFVALSVTTASAQLGAERKISWKIALEQTSPQQYKINCEATLAKGWHVYGAQLPENTAIPTTLFIQPNAQIKLLGSVQEFPAPEVHFDESFQAKLTWHNGKATFSQAFEYKGAEKLTLTGYIEYMVCNDETCMPPDQEEFSFDLKPEAQPAPQTAGTPSEVDASTPGTSESVSSKPANLTATPSDNVPAGYWNIFILAFVAGLAALLTPCVFPMIPMTVSFFTKQSKNKAVGIRNAILYGISIIVIYVVLGTVVVAVFGAGSLNALSSNPLFNLFFFVLLVVFAISFLGAFEIVLPNSWVNMADRNADKGGVLGIFFMAFTLALVSFSCTGPLVGTIIVEAARNGGLAPVIGMLGFSLAIALPFAFFAAFPGYLNSLPKSGGWLNSVKVVLGFLELAFAFKFLSNADMALDLHLLEREVFLAIWIAIFGTLAFYLFGKIKLPHDSTLDHLPVSRLILGITVLAFIIYLIPGMWGAPVKLISGFPPSSNYAESPLGVGASSSAPETIGHANSPLPGGMHPGPQNIPAFDDYHQALQYAKQTGKPLMLDFTGKTCVNCRKMEDNVWSDPRVKSMLTHDYILVSLYVDLRKELPENERYVSSETGKTIKNIGQKWADFQLTRFHVQGQPYYVLLSPDEEQLALPMSFNLDVEAYLQWLKQGVSALQK